MSSCLRDSPAYLLTADTELPSATEGTVLGSAFATVLVEPSVVS